MVKTLCFHCRGTRLILGQGTKILYAVQHDQKKKKTQSISLQRLCFVPSMTTALSDSMKLSHAMWGHPRRPGRGGEV